MRKEVVSVEESKIEKSPTLFVEKDEQKLYLHSKYTPRKEAEAWVNENMDENSKDYIIFGGGLYYHVQELLQRMDSKSSALVIEPSKQIYDLSTRFVDVQKLANENDLSLFCYGEIQDEEEIKKLLYSILGLKKTHRLRVLVFGNYQRLYAKECSILLQAIKDHILFERIDDNTSSFFAIEHTMNIFSNLFYGNEATLVMNFRDRFKGKTAVVVSAGPSLAKNVELLKGNEDRLIIIAGGRTLKTLLDKGIRPHFFVSLDPSYENFLLIKDVLEENVPLVTSFLANREIIKQYQGEKIFMNNTGIPGFGDFFFDRHIDTLPVNGTVAVMQMNFAAYMGCSTIILIGQDLAYTDGKSHSELTLLLDEEKNGGNEVDLTSKGLYKVKGNIEDVVYTDGVLYHFIKIFRESIENLSEVKVYNCTEGGAYIEGAEASPLKQCIDRVEEKEDYYKEIDQIISENKLSFSKEQVRKRVEDLCKESSQIIKFAKSGIALTEKIIKKGKEEENQRKRLKKIDKNINRLTDRFHISKVLSRNILSQIGAFEIDERKSVGELEMEVWKLKRIFYAAVQGIYMRFRFIMEETIKEVFDEKNEDR